MAHLCFALSIDTLRSEEYDYFYSHHTDYPQMIPGHHQVRDHVFIYSKMFLVIICNFLHPVLFIFIYKVLLALVKFILARL